MKPAEAQGRRQAREAALQMLYGWEIGRVTPGDAILAYWPTHDEAGGIAERHREFANTLVRGTVGRLDEIDRLIAGRTKNWRVERMAVLDRLILRLGTYELLAHPETPAKVVINEALELARRFAGDETVAFVNGVLDAIRKDLGRE